MVRAVCSFCGSQPEKVPLCRSAGLPHTKNGISALHCRSESAARDATSCRNQAQECYCRQIPTMTSPGRMQRGTRDRLTFPTSSTAVWANVPDGRAQDRHYSQLQFPTTTTHEQNLLLLGLRNRITHLRLQTLRWSGLWTLRIISISVNIACGLIRILFLVTFLLTSIWAPDSWDSS